VADGTVPFWRRMAEAAGLSGTDRPDPAAPAPAPAAAPPAPTPPPTPTPAPAGSVATPPVATPPVAGPPVAATPVATPPVAPAPTEPTAAEILLELWFARAEDDQLAWRQAVPGPTAAEIGTRLSLVPPSFLDDAVAIRQLAEHILQPEYDAGGDPHNVRMAAYQARATLGVVDQVRDTGSRAARRGAALALWLWASDGLHGPLSVPLTPSWRDRALAAMAFRLASVVDPLDWVRDADRRDEAARIFLFWSGHLPDGEDEATARSILGMRDSLLQNAALAQTLVDHEHRLEVTRRLNAARAREAAARYSSE